ncbi:hypothetical protein R3I93_011732 [Phoxinus phoxinus]|uniref:Uncharacterized protein n=1 Tax=Phoxinus phoxinus TaxID=58324 RepID=A0AAN9CWT1_9TELE
MRLLEGAVFLDSTLIRLYRPAVHQTDHTAYSLPSNPDCKIELQPQLSRPAPDDQVFRVSRHYRQAGATLLHDQDWTPLF